LRLTPRARAEGNIPEGGDEWRKMADARAKGQEEEQAGGTVEDAGSSGLRRSARKKK
jgi:hypothetical protein